MTEILAGHRHRYRFPSPTGAATITGACACGSTQTCDADGGAAARGFRTYGKMLEAPPAKRGIRLWRG